MTRRFVFSTTLLIWITLSSIFAIADETPPEKTIEMAVTEKGFEPDQVKVEKGKPVKLIITRKTEKTCAKEIVIDEYNINVNLPFNTPVTVTFTPTQGGQLTYGCAMGKMIRGVISVE